MGNNNAPIGVFDSGVGGLTVFKEIRRQIPNERIVYFGDTARVPYGSKSKDTVIKYTRQIINFLTTHDVKALVMACNTMSANALDEIEKEIDIPIIGVVKPGAFVASQNSKNGRIGVIATEATIRSGLYERYIKDINDQLTVFGKACPLFCPLVEEGMLEDPVTEEMARRYLSELIEKDIDTLILGCTHYPLLSRTIGKVVGEKVRLVNPAKETANELKNLLQDKKLLSEEAYEERGEENEFYVSDAAEKFTTFAASILNEESLTSSLVAIDKY